MKYYLICALIGSTLTIGTYLYIESNKTVPVMSNIPSAELNKDQDELLKYRQEDAARRLRQAELDKIQNPEIVVSQLHAKGKLIVYGGEVEHKDLLTQKSFWGDKNLNLNLKYKFGISYDLSEIKVVSIVEKNVIIKVDINRLCLEYLELINDSQVDGQSSLLVSDFKPDEVNMTLKNAYNKTTVTVNENREIFNQAFIELKTKLTELISKMGYTKVIFDI